MHDAATAIAPLTPNTRPQRVQALPRTRVSRAHLAWQARPALRAELDGVLAPLAKTLTDSVGAPVGLSAALRPGTVDVRQVLSMHGVFALLELGGVGALGVLELEINVAMSLLAAIAGSTDRAPALGLSRIEEAALGWLALEALSVVRQHRFVEERLRPRLVGVFIHRRDVLDALPPTPGWAATDVRVSLPGVEGRGQLLMPTGAALAALMHEPVSAPAAIAPEILAAGYEFSVSGGPAFLSAADAAQLSEGDVVLFSELKLCAGLLSGEVRLAGRPGTLTGELSPQGFHQRRAQARNIKERTMAKEDSSLPVDVEVELARVRLTLEDLHTLRSGSVLPLSLNAAQLVTLRIGDRPVAKAELVDIDGELGARIVSLI